MVEDFRISVFCRQCHNWNIGSVLQLSISTYKNELSKHSCLANLFIIRTAKWNSLQLRLLLKIIHYVL